MQTDHCFTDPLCRFCCGCCIYCNCNHSKLSKGKDTIQPLFGIKWNLAVTACSFQTRLVPVLKTDALPKNDTSCTTNFVLLFGTPAWISVFASIISRSVSSGILLEARVYFADYVSIIWFDRSIKNVVRRISHCCFFIAFRTTCWNYRLILVLLDVHDEMNFLLSPLHFTWGFWKIVFFFFFCFHPMFWYHCWCSDKISEVWKM